MQILNAYTVGIPTHVIFSDNILVKSQSLPASLVVSIQIPGYIAGEMVVNATAGIVFPIKVCEYYV